MKRILINGTQQEELRVASVTGQNCAAASCRATSLSARRRAATSCCCERSRVRQDDCIGGDSGGARRAWAYKNCVLRVQQSSTGRRPRAAGWATCGGEDVACTCACALCRV